MHFEPWRIIDADSGTTRGCFWPRGNSIAGNRGPFSYRRDNHDGAGFWRTCHLQYYLRVRATPIHRNVSADGGKTQLKLSDVRGAWLDDKGAVTGPSRSHSGKALNNGGRCRCAPSMIGLQAGSAKILRQRAARRCNAVGIAALQASQGEIRPAEKKKSIHDIMLHIDGRSFSL